MPPYSATFDSQATVPFSTTPMQQTSPTETVPMSPAVGSLTLEPKGNVPKAQDIIEEAEDVEGKDVESAEVNATKSCANLDNTFCGDPLVEGVLQPGGFFRTYEDLEAAVRKACPQGLRSRKHNKTGSKHKPRGVFTCFYVPDSGNANSSSSRQVNRFDNCT